MHVCIIELLLHWNTVNTLWKWYSRGKGSTPLSLLTSSSSANLDSTVSKNPVRPLLSTINAIILVLETDISFLFILYLLILLPGAAPWTLPETCLASGLHGHIVWPQLTVGGPEDGGSRARSSKMGIFSGLRGWQGLFHLDCRRSVEHLQTLLLAQNQLPGGFVLDFLSG